MATFESLYQSGHFEEIPVKMASDEASELVKKIEEQNTWFQFFKEPGMEIQKKDKLEVILDAGEEILEEVKESGQLLPLVIVSGILICALLSFNVYWIKSYCSKQSEAKESDDVEKTGESTETETEADSSMMQYENEPSRHIPSSSQSFEERWRQNMDDLSVQDEELSLCCKNEYGSYESNTEENESKEQDSDKYDNISESSVKIEFEIRTFEAKDVELVKETDVDKDESQKMEKKEKTVKCHFCDQKFQDDNGMRTHCLAKHKYDSRNNSTKQNQLDSGIDSSLENISQSNLPSNIMSIESETNSFTRKSRRRRSGGKNRQGLALTIPCDLCDGFFATDTGLQSHKSSKH